MWLAASFLSSASSGNLISNTINNVSSGVNAVTGAYKQYKADGDFGEAFDNLANGNILQAGVSALKGTYNYMVSNASIPKMFKDMGVKWSLAKLFGSKATDDYYRAEGLIKEVPPDVEEAKRLLAEKERKIEKLKNKTLQIETTFREKFDRKKKEIQIINEKYINKIEEKNTNVNEDNNIDEELHDNGITYDEDFNREDIEVKQAERKLLRLKRQRNIEKPDLISEENPDDNDLDLDINLMQKCKFLKNKC